MAIELSIHPDKKELTLSEVTMEKKKLLFSKRLQAHGLPSSEEHIASFSNDELDIMSCLNSDRAV